MGQRQMTRFGWVAGVGALVVMLPWQLSAFPTSESGERQVVRSIEEGQGQSTVTRSLLGTNAQDTTASTGTQAQDSQRRQRQQDETQGQRGSATSTGTTRSTQSSHATGSSSSSATSVSSGGSQRDGSSNVSRSISYSKDGNSISVKQRGDRFTVERTRRVDGKDKVEKFEFKSEDEFRRRLPEDFKRFKEMTSASLGSHGGGVEVKGGGDAVDNPAQQQLLEHLRKMREENADNPQIRQLIDQMIREILTSSTDDRAK